MIDLAGRLAAICGEDNIRRDAPLASLTTFKVGGAADWLIDVHGEDMLAEVIAIAQASGTPLTVLGGGSNVLVADSGVRGIVVRVRGGEVKSIGPSLVRAEAGLTINGLVRWTINRGIAGIEAWAGTPGTVGGAVYGNAHFKGRSIDELIEAVRLVGADGVVRSVPHR